MIETIANLLKDSGASKANISVMLDPNNSDNVHIVINTHMPPAKTGKGIQDEKAEVIKLRHALSSPITISGVIGEVDVGMTEALEQFAYGYEKGAEVLKDASDLVSNIESASSAVKPKATPKETKKKADTEPSQPVEPKPTSAFTQTDDDDESL